MRSAAGYRPSAAGRPLYQRSSPKQHTSQPVSKTDVILFQQLANHERVIIPEDTNKLFAQVQQSGVPPNLGTGGNMQSAPPQSGPGKTPFDRLTQQKYRSRGGPSRTPQSDSSESSSYYSGSSSGSESDVAMTPPGYGRSGYGRPDMNYGGRGGGGGVESETPMSQQFDSGSSGSEDASPSMYPHGSFNPPMPVLNAPEQIYDAEIDMSNRQLYIQELLQYQRDGNHIGIEITDSTPTHVLKSECDLINESINTAAGVERMKFALAFLMRMVELANAKLCNNFLPLAGWTEKTMNTNSSQFDVPLRRLHNLYFRNSFGHPLMQLGMALVFSAGGYMMMNDSSFLGRMMGPVAPPATTPAPQQQTPMPPPVQQPLTGAPMGGAGAFAPKFSNMSTMNEVATEPVNGGPPKSRRAVRPPNLGGRPVSGNFPVS